jgi:hypothetical protein
MRWLIPLACLAAACGSSPSGSLQGGNTFTPTTVLAARPVLANGAVGNNLLAVYLSASNPSYSCTTLDAGFPDSGTIQGVVEVVVAQNGALTEGTYPIATSKAFYAYVAGGGSDGGFDAGLAAIGQSAPVTPPSAELGDFADSISGSLTLTQTGDAWAGTFSATMALTNDGGLSLLSGNFYTGSICYLNDY